MIKFCFREATEKKRAGDLEGPEQGHREPLSLPIDQIPELETRVILFEISPRHLEFSFGFWVFGLLGGPCWVVV